MSKRTFIKSFGLISVIEPLVFVGVEISQNTQVVRWATHQIVAEQINELTLTIASDKRLAKIVSSMYNSSMTRADMSPEDLLSLDFLLLTGFRRVESIYL